jgi:hypothetical protein
MGVHVENLSTDWKVIYENRTPNVEGVVLAVLVHPQDTVQWRAIVNSEMNLGGP